MASMYLANRVAIACCWVPISQWNLTHSETCST